MGDFSKLCSTLRGSWTEDPQSCDGEWSTGSLVVTTSASRPEAGAAFHSLLSSSKAQAGCVMPEPGMQVSWSFLLREDVELFVLCNPPPPPRPPPLGSRYPLTGRWERRDLGAPELGLLDSGW